MDLKITFYFAYFSFNFRRGEFIQDFIRFQCIQYCCNPERRKLKQNIMIGEYQTFNIFLIICNITIVEGITLKLWYLNSASEIMH